MNFTSVLFKISVQISKNPISYELQQCNIFKELKGNEN